MKAFFSTFAIIAILSGTLYAQPGAVRVTNINHKSISLAWNSVSNASEYRVYASGVYIQGIPDTFYTIYNLESNTFYLCEVSAVVSGSESEKSAGIDTSTTLLSLSPNQIDPYTDIEYLGAFALSNDGTTAEYHDFAYTKSELAFYPDGDPGNSDSLSGSLFIGGHIYGRLIAEVNIPLPVKSKNISALPKASCLQPFTNLKWPNLAVGPLTNGPGLEYLPAQGSQTCGYLYTSFSDDYQVGGERLNSFGAASLNFSSPELFGGWYVGPTAAYSAPSYMATTKFIFSMPFGQENEYALVAGGSRYGYGGNGPTLVAYFPWQASSPLPSDQEVLPVTTLLQYQGQSYTENCLNGARENDLWQGGAWLKRNNRSAIAVCGEKAMGDFWYDHGPRVTSYKHLILFYDSEELLEVAAGIRDAYLPQPYAILDVGSNMLNLNSNGPSGMTFDEANGNIYLIERNVSNAQPVIHVFKLKDNNSTIESNDKPVQVDFSIQACPNPFNPSTRIRIQQAKASEQRPDIKIYNLAGKLVQNLTSYFNPLTSEATWHARTLASGVYLIQAKIGNKTMSKKILLQK